MKTKLLLMALLCSGTTFAGDVNLMEQIKPFTEGSSSIRCSDVESSLEDDVFRAAQIALVPAQGQMNLHISGDAFATVVLSVNRTSDRIATGNQTVLNVQNDAVGNYFMSDSQWVKNKKKIVGTNLQTIQFVDGQTLKYKSIYTDGPNAPVRQKFCDIVKK